MFHFPAEPVHYFSLWRPEDEPGSVHIELDGVVKMGGVESVAMSSKHLTVRLLPSAVDRFGHDEIEVDFKTRCGDLCDWLLVFRLLVKGFEDRATSPQIRADTLNSQVRRMAEAIGSHWAFENLAILADALEDAGCTDVDVLEHCRAGEIHSRKCWVVDSILDAAGSNS